MRRGAGLRADRAPAARWRAGACTAEAEGPEGQWVAAAPRDPAWWKLTVTGVHADGTTYRLYRTVYADTEEEARAEQARLVAEIRATDRTTRADARRVTLDSAVRRFLYEHLLDERGREPKTVDDYWKLHVRWFSAELGERYVRDLTRPMFDARFGAMRRAR